MVTLVNRAYVATSTTGTGSVTLATPEPGFQSFADAGVTNGQTVRYTITEESAWEIGTGTYSSTGPTLTRSPSESSAGGSAINLTGGALVFVTAAAEDIAKVITLDNKTTTYTVVADDLGKIIHATGDGTFTVTIPGASTAGAGFNVKIWNTGDGTITISGGGVIDGGSLTSRVLYAWEGVELVSDGTNWYSGSTKSTRYYAENGNDGNTTRPIASGLYSIGLGGASTASGTASLAVGLGTTASGTSSNAFGRSSANAGAVAAGNGSLALNGSYAGGAESVAAGIGTNNVTYGATAANSIALGQLTKATGANSVAIGDNSTSSNTSTVALGTNSTASGLGSVAVGNSTSSGTLSLSGNTSTASGNYSVALGQSSTASGANAVAIGTSASATVANQIALGGTADTVKVSGTYTLPTTDGTDGQVLTTDGSGAVTFADVGGALELYAENPSSPTAPSATGANAVAIGSGATTSGTESGVAIGTGSSASNKAVAIGQGTTSANGGVAIGGYTYGATASGAGSVAIGGWIADAVASSSYSVAIGEGTDATSARSLAIGNDAQAVTGVRAVAIGQSRASGTASFAAAIANNTSSYGATGSNSVAIGNNAKATGADSFALGESTQATGADAFALGRTVRSTSSYAVAMGYNCLSSANYSVALGYNATASGSNAFAAGASSTFVEQATASGAGSVALGGAYATATDSVSIGASSTTGTTIGKIAFSNDKFSANGDSQLGTFVLRSDTTDATPEALTTNNSTAGTTNQIILPNNSAYSFSGTIIARESAAAGSDYASWEIKGALLRDANAASTVLGNGIQNKLYATAGASAWDIALTADTTNGGLKIEVTGAASTNIRWVATVHTSEVTYA